MNTSIAGGPALMKSVALGLPIGFLLLFIVLVLLLLLILALIVILRRGRAGAAMPDRDGEALRALSQGMEKIEQRITNLETILMEHRR
jgi:phage shock protein B